MIDLSGLRGRVFAVALVMFSIAGAASASAQQAFFNLSGGFIPPAAVPSGHEANGEPLFTCVALYNNGSHPGKIRPGFNGCNIGYGGGEISVFEYAILSGNGHWVATSGNNVPGNALQGGWEPNGAPLYYCRAYYNNGVHPGKTRPGFNGCNIGYGGGEITVFDYDVVIQ